MLWKENYKPYGGKLTRSPASSDNKSGFHGKAFDDGTGPSYMGARHYGPVLGRFMGIDPVDYQEDNLHSFNRYAYTNNNPYKYVDPDGKIPLLAIPLLEYLLPIAASFAAGCVAQTIANRFSNGTLTTPDFQGVLLSTTHINETSRPSTGILYSEGASSEGTTIGESDDRVSLGDKALSPGEIGKLKEAGIDPHDLKPNKNGFRYDLFKDKNENITVKPKAGNGPGDPTGININDY